MNIGLNFENWVANSQNYQKALNKQYVPDFDFVGTDMSKIPVEQKPAVYKNAVLNIAQSRIQNYDVNKNGKMEFDEYIKEQNTIYKKTFGESLQINSSKFQQLLKQVFDNCDLNKDGSIDDKEMSATFAYMDTSSSSGKLDGKISYTSAMFTDFSNKQLSPVLSELKKFIFGN